MKSGIVQWNCRGLRANYYEIDRLIEKFCLVAIYLQESMLPTNYTFPSRHYTAYLNSNNRGNDRPIGGVALLVNNNTPHRLVAIDSNLQAVAARVSLEKAVTICSIYLPPNSHWDCNDLVKLIGEECCCLPTMRLLHLVDHRHEYLS